eukprot:364628_1
MFWICLIIITIVDSDQISQYHRYVLHDLAMSRPEHEIYCQSQYNSHLASVHCTDEENELITLINSVTDRGYIGLMKNAVQWTDGSDVTFTEKLAYSGDGNCIELNTYFTQAEWNDYGLCNYAALDLLINCSKPTNIPTPVPTQTPTPEPTINPTATPTSNPTPSPTYYPSTDPTNQPTEIPSNNPTFYPTSNPSLHPTYYPTNNPTIEPTIDPTDVPSVEPSMEPTLYPTSHPTPNPSCAPTFYPTTSPVKTPVQKNCDFLRLNLTIRSFNITQLTMIINKKSKFQDIVKNNIDEYYSQHNDNKLTVTFDKLQAANNNSLAISYDVLNCNRNIQKLIDYLHSQIFNSSLIKTLNDIYHNLTEVDRDNKTDPPLAITSIHTKTIWSYLPPPFVLETF